MHALIARLVAANPETAGVPGVDTLASSIERGGLYAIIAILLLTVGYLFVSKERQRDKLHEEYKTMTTAFHAKLIEVVSEEAKVLTRQAMLTEKVENALVRVLTKLEE